MKMGCLFSATFWGILLIILGIMILFKVFVFRILLSLLLIYAGIKVLTGGPIFKKGKNTILFSDSKIEATSSSEKYNILFGKGLIDFSNVSLTNANVKTEINTIFAAGILKINPELPTKIVVSSAFAGAKMPDGNVVSFGEYTYKSPNFKPEENYLEIKANVVFGGLEIVSK